MQVGAVPSSMSSDRSGGLVHDDEVLEMPSVDGMDAG